MKCEASQELVVGGFTDPQGRRVGLGALLVGYFEGRDLVFAGKVGTGFDTALLPIAACAVWTHWSSPTPPFTKGTGLPRLRVHWVRPEIVVQVAFTEWTPCTASSATRACSASAPTRRHATSCGSGRDDHASRQGAASRTTGSPRASLAAYYDAVAPFMLPHLRRRPITMERFPGGIGGKGFLQKNVVKGFPPWLKRVEAPKKGGTVHYPLAGDRRSLQWLANQNTITLHVWASRAPRLDRPDLCIFDLDPSQDDARGAADRHAWPARTPR